MKFFSAICGQIRVCWQNHTILSNLMKIVSLLIYVLILTIKHRPEGLSPSSPSSHTPFQKNRISMLWELIKAPLKGTLLKLWAAIQLKFQWRKLVGEDFLGTGFVSILPEISKILTRI